VYEEYGGIYSKELLAYIAVAGTPNRSSDVRFSISAYIV
jgi:hypothetical protein